MKYTKEEKEKIIKSFQDVNDRVMKKLKLRMLVLSKDKRLKAQMEKEIIAYLSK
jgi:hypothetical protein